MFSTHVIEISRSKLFMSLGSFIFCETLCLTEIQNILKITPKRMPVQKKRTHGQLCLVLPRHNGPLSSPTLVTDSHRSNWGYVWDASDHTALHNCRALPFSIITDVFFLLSLPSLLFPIDLRWVGRHHAGQQDGKMTRKNGTSFIYGQCMQRKGSESLLVIMMTTFLELKLLISFI